MNGDRARRGFTLIELLVVMAIISTLLMLAVPRYLRSLDRAREATLRQDLAVMREAMDKYLGDTGHYPDNLEELVRARYLRSVPVDPYTRSAASWVLVPSDDPQLAGARDVLSGAEGLTPSGTPLGEL
ncbi:MAG: prepilin-type N-terminal cleavage/methylation domain-containing protein [Steroidobacteraceae bacterium]